MTAEIKVVSSNLKSLEASEVQASKAEEGYANQVRDLGLKSKEAEVRAETAERAVQRLQKEVDRFEDQLLEARTKNMKLNEDMETALRDIQDL